MHSFIVIRIVKLTKMYTVTYLHPVCTSTSCNGIFTQIICVKVSLYDHTISVIFCHIKYDLKKLFSGVSAMISLNYNFIIRKFWLVERNDNPLHGLTHF